MPTIQQLVRKGRTPKVSKTKAAARASKPAARTRASAKGRQPAASKPASKTGDVNAAWWSVLEAAWKTAAPELKATRAKMAANEASDDDYDAIEEALEGVVSELSAAFEELDAPALLEVDRALERVLHSLDRQEIQEVTDGSDDGFLYCRGFIAAISKEYVEAVLEDPNVARVDRENGDIAYLPFHAYTNRFGKMPRNETGISRESCTNADGWAD